MFCHHPVSLRKGGVKPVLPDFTFLVHWVKAHGGVVGEVWMQPLLAHHRFAVLVGREFRFIGWTPQDLTPCHKTLSVLFDRGDIFRDFGHGNERIDGHERRSQPGSQQTLVDGVDF